MHPYQLAVRSVDGRNRIVSLDGSRYTVGRSQSNDLSFPDDGNLSRNHLTFQKDGNAWIVQDLGSRNGTKCNGKRIERAVLQAGDIITVGSQEITFVVPKAIRDRQVEFVDTPITRSSGTVVVNLQEIMGATGALIRNDLSESKNGAPRTHPLIRAGQELAGHRPLDELFPVILGLAVEAVNASRGLLMLLEQETLTTKAVLGRGFRISSTVRDQVLRKQSLLVQDVQLDDRLRMQESIVAQSVRSMIAVPLQTQDNVLGLIYVDTTELVRPFTEDDLRLLTVMANIAAIRIEHARLLEVERKELLLARDMQQAAEIQQNLLPTAAPVIEGLQVAALSVSCRSVGGDYFDFFPLADGRYVFLIGDVAGKGMPAALLMTSLQARVQILLETAIDMDQLVRRLNISIATSCPNNRFITFFICTIDPRSGEITYCNAGHNPPLLVRSSGEVFRLEGGGPVLGVLRSFPYVQNRCKMEAEDLLVLFTDGVTEAEAFGIQDAKEEIADFGEERLLELIRTHHQLAPAELMEQLTQAVTDFAGSVSASDDFTAMILRKSS